MKSSKTVLSILAVSMLFAACQSVEFRKSSGGVPYKIFSSKKGDSVRVGTIVKYEVIQKIKDSTLYSSYERKRPEYFQVRPAGEKATYANIKATVEEVIGKAKEGDSIYLAQATDSLIKENPQQSMFKKGQQLVTTIRIEKVYKNETDANADYMKEQAAGYEENKKQGLVSFKKDTAAQASIQKDDKEIEDYLKAHNIQAEKNEWGLYIERITPGSGPKPKFGQYSNVNYKGMDLAGEVFDQGTMPVQVGVSQVVYGFMEGVSQLSKGEKARIYIPSMLGYGPQGSPPRIKPNEILVFELQVLDITDKAPAQPQQPQVQPQQQPAQQPTDDKKQK
ncbi:MAG TPA: FKBP-type peptidyl-prolyl cis-trans isomerase [Flavisolibacter sp.]